MSTAPEFHSTTWIPHSEIRRGAGAKADWRQRPALDRMVRHIGIHFGTVSALLLSDPTHEGEEGCIDLCYVGPGQAHDFHTFVTAGMSNARMAVPTGQAGGVEYAELLLHLPKSWPVGPEALRDPELRWPLGYLKQLARWPHRTACQFSWNMLVPNGSPPLPFSPQTDLCGFWLVPPYGAPEAFATLEASPGFTIQVLCLVPLYREEMEIFTQQGSDRFLDLLQEQKVDLGELLIWTLNRRNLGLGASGSKRPLG